MFIQKNKNLNEHARTELQVSEELYYGFKGGNVIELFQRNMDLNTTLKLIHELFKINNETEKNLIQCL